MLARGRSRIGVAGRSEYRISSNWPLRLNTVKGIETKAKSKELDTIAFLLNLAKFSRIWVGGGGGYFIRENFALTLLEMRGTHVLNLIEIGLKLWPSITNTCTHTHARTHTRIV